MSTTWHSGQHMLAVGVAQACVLGGAEASSLPPGKCTPLRSGVGSTVKEHIFFHFRYAWRVPCSDNGTNHCYPLRHSHRIQDTDYVPRNRQHGEGQTRWFWKESLPPHTVGSQGVSGQKNNSSQVPLQGQCRGPTWQRQESRRNETAKAREEKMAASTGLLLEDKHVHAASGKVYCLQRKCL